MTDTNSGDTQNNTTTESVNNMRNRLSDLRKTFDSYVTLQKQEKEDLRQQNENLIQKNEILLNKYRTLEDALAEQGIGVNECVTPGCDHIVVGQFAPQEFKDCYICYKMFCYKHFFEHGCINYGCSGI